MEDLIESLQSASADRRPAAFRAVVASLKRAAAEDPDAAEYAIRRLVSYDLDYSTADSLGRICQTLKRAKPVSSVRKLAVLGSFTTHQLAGLIELYLFAAGIRVEVYEADYGVVQQEILDPSSGLHRFHPDLVYLAVDRRSLGRRPTADGWRPASSGGRVGRC